MASKNLVLIEESDIAEIESKTGKKLVRKGTYVSIEGDDRERLKILFNKTLSGTIEINELRAMTALFAAICEYHKQQPNK